MPTTSSDVEIRFDNSYARLPDRFFARLAPTSVEAPRLVRLNERLARELGLDPAALATPDGVAVLAGNRVPEGAEPLAQAYAGHQFGSFVPQLGDGRAILLGEIVTPAGERRDIQLKGSGRTPFSRQGDGRAALGPVLREYIVAEAMAALGIATTRSLAAVLTGEPVYRETTLPGAVLTRIAASHIRVGTFQYFAVRGDIEGVRLLADHVIARHYPEAEAGAGADRYRRLLELVISRQARLVAQWMQVGFIHGVMNTDNTSIAGETIDYGPCAFMDTYDPGTVYSSIDQRGRYAFANQPRILQWNLGRLAETLLVLLGTTEEEQLATAQTAINGFADQFREAYVAGLRRKLGLATADPDDLALGHDLLDRMTAGKADYTLTFRRLADAALSAEAEKKVGALFEDPALFAAWAERWRERLARESATPESRHAMMRKANPAFIPRNHRVEEALAAAVERDDLAPLDRLVAVLARPFDDQPENAAYMDPPKPHEIVQATFCGT